MPVLSIDKPPIVRLDGVSPESIDRVRDLLTFQDKGVDFLIQKHKKNRWWKRSNPEEWLAHHEMLKAKRKVCILFQNENGDHFTYAGLSDQVRNCLFEQEVQVVNNITYPDLEGMAWSRKPEHPPRYYQDEMKAALLAAKHAAVSVGTGLGKSRVIMELCHDIGLRAVVMAPSRSIASQLFRDFSRHLGSRYVGMYGDGKKQVGKLITIGIAASLTRIQPGTEAWEWFRGCHVFAADESHLCPADTLERVCMGLLENAEYRFFFSATQVRMDGSEKVLAGITGPVVYNMSVQQGVDEGFLAKPLFKMIRVRSNDSYETDDVNKMTQRHLFYNADVLRRAGEIASQAHRLLGHQVLILVDELAQFPALLPHLKHKAMFAHGAARSDKAMQKVLPQDQWDSEPTELVDRFNECEFPVLVGTSCINTGTDIKSVQTCIYLAGGKSSIQVPQSVGRTTRLWREKRACSFVDFAPMLLTENYDDTDREEGNMSPVFRHALARAEMYQDIYPSLKWLDSSLRPC